MPRLVLLQGGTSNATLAWEADIERDVGAFIAQYLQRNPCPGPSRLAEDWHDWATRLEARHAA